MVIVNWGVNDLPPPVFEDVGMNVYIRGCGCYIYAHDRGRARAEVLVSDTASITNLLNSNSNSNRFSSFEELEEQAQLLPLSDIYTLTHLHHLYMQFLDDQVYPPLESDGASTSVDIPGWMGRGVLSGAIGG